MLKNVRVESKGERPDRMNKEWFEQSSDVTIWSLWDQSWQTLVDEGLSYLFTDETEFKERVKQWHVTTETRRHERTEQTAGT